MWPRLNLLYELLADDGVLVVTIDDNEQHRLRSILDEIFQLNDYSKEDIGNFYGHIAWQKKYATSNDAKVFRQCLITFYSIGKALIFRGTC